MNLRVDLILETERRSGSIVSNKGALRIVAAVVPVLLVGYVALQFLQFSQLRLELEEQKTSLQREKPQQEKAKALLAEFQTHKEIGAELSGWAKSRVSWAEQLRGLMRIAPPNVQLVDLRISHNITLTEDSQTARVFALALKGKATGDDAEPHVKRLQNDLKGSPAFTSLVQDVVIPLYSADTSPDAKRDDRIFQIDCAYRKREFR